MKKNKLTFLILASIITLLYILSASFTLGTVKTPVNYWTSATNSERDNSYFNSFVNVDISRTKPSKENPDENDTANISKIYVYIGDAHTYFTEASGKSYITINFDFKTKSSNDTSYYSRRETVKLPVVYGVSSYGWVKVFDAEENKQGEITFSRVKINTPDSFDFHEVVFTDKAGYVLSLSAPDLINQEFAQTIIDEQEKFTTSQSKKHHFTEGELQSVGAVLSMKGGEKVRGVGSLTTVFDFVGTTIFGLNTFGMRFFDFVFGLATILLSFFIVKRIFATERSGVMATLFTLAIGGVFTSSTFAFGTVGGFFAILSFYFAIDYFISYYYYEEITKLVSEDKKVNYGTKKESIKTLVLIGVTYGLAVCSNFVYALTVLGLLGLFALSQQRANKQYKKDEKEAVGLKKEDVFQANRKRNILSNCLFILSVLVVPTVLVILTSLLAGKGYTDGGFFANVWNAFVSAIKPDYKFKEIYKPFALFAGFGGQSLNGYYTFLNYIPTLLCALSFIFTTVVMITQNKVEAFKEVGTITNTYKILTVSFVAFALTVFFGNTSPYGFGVVSVFYSAYIIFAEKILGKIIKKKTVKVIFNILVIISLVVFGMAYLGLVGVSLPDIVNKILYLWQVL